MQERAKVGDELQMRGVPDRGAARVRLHRQLLTDDRMQSGQIQDGDVIDQPTFDPAHLRFREANSRPDLLEAEIAIPSGIPEIRPSGDGQAAATLRSCIHGSLSGRHETG